MSCEMTISVAASAPGCHTLSHGTSAPNNARPRAVGLPYSMAIVVNATCCITLPRWLNGYICAWHGAAVSIDVTSSRVGSIARMLLLRCWTSSLYVIIVTHSVTRRIEGAHRSPVALATLTQYGS